MRTDYAWILLVLAACASSATPAAKAPLARRPAVAAAAPIEHAEAQPDPAESPAQTLAADTPETTVAGNPFIAPRNWTIRVRGAGTILESPEGGSVIAIYDFTDVADADAAIAKAWTQYKGKLPYALLDRVQHADIDGWSKVQGYAYDVPPNFKRVVAADARFASANGTWTAVILDMDQAAAEKRGAQIMLILGKLLPRGRARESFAGKQALPLDAARIAELKRFIRNQFQRKLLEVLFEGKPEADARVASQAKAFFQQIETARRLLTVPADPALAARLAPKYTNAALGAIAVSQKDGRWSFDFGEYASEVASRTNPDGSVSFITIAPGALGLELVVGEQGGKPTLTIRDGQHEYVFVPVG